MAAESDAHAGATVIRLPIAVPTTHIPAHLRVPMSNAERRRTAARGIPKAREALARRRIRAVDDG